MSRSRENVKDLRDIDVNTSNSHTHINKTILDNIEVALSQADADRYLDGVTIAESDLYVKKTDYATNKIAGSIKARLVGDVLYLSTTSANA